jgi:hypothetical protein
LRQAKTLGASSAVMMSSDSSIAAVRFKKGAVLDGLDGSVGTWQNLSIDKALGAGKMRAAKQRNPNLGPHGGYSWSRS